MSETYIYGNTGDVNTQIGTNTLTSITTGVNNTAFGDTVFANLTTGSGNSGFGTNVGSAIGGNPTNTTAFGFETLKNMTTPANVSALGYQALMNLTTGNNNTGMGSGVGSNITSAADNTLFGYGADVVNSSTINATSVGQNSKSSSNSTVIGYNAQSLSTSATAYNVIIGTDTVADAASIQSIIFGNNAAVGTTINSVLMGYQAAGGSIGNMIDSSVILGWSAAENIQDSFEDVIIGPEAARNVDFSQRNVLVGVGANKTPVPATTGGSPLEYVVALGYEAGIQNSAPGNTFVGSGCGTNITNQTEITAIGVSALKYVEGSFNTAVGRRAMLGVDTVSIGAVNNVAVGEDALCSITTGFDNVVFGTRAGMSLTTGSNNVIMGHEADVGAAVTDSVVMGAGASATADNSVVIGEGASSTVDGGIAIGNDVVVTVAGDIQIGDPVALAIVGDATFRSQIFARGKWSGEGVTEVMIDNDGNIHRVFTSTILDTSSGTTTLALATYELPLNSAHRIEVLLTGRRTDGGGLNDMYSARLDCAAKNDGTTATINTVEEIQLKDDAAWVIAFVSVGLTVELQVTGVVGSSIDWTADVREFLI